MSNQRCIFKPTNKRIKSTSKNNQKIMPITLTLNKWVWLIKWRQCKTSQRPKQTNKTWHCLLKSRSHNRSDPIRLHPTPNSRTEDSVLSRMKSNDLQTSRVESQIDRERINNSNNNNNKWLEWWWRCDRVMAVQCAELTVVDSGLCYDEKFVIFSLFFAKWLLINGWLP